MIGSRDKLCINDDLAMKSNSDEIHICKTLMKNAESYDNDKPTCEYYQKIAHRKSYIEDCLEPREIEQSINNIEDLQKHGRFYNCSSYFMSKKVAENADIIFLPYSYLIEPTLRNEINLNGTIVIIDEAYNVNQVCEDSSSTFIELL